MVEVHADRERQILTIKLSQRVSAQEMESHLPRVNDELDKLKSGFIVFTDLSALEFMENTATDQIGTYMGIFNEKGVSRIVRLVPDPSKDVGFKLLAIFHYDEAIPTVTCETEDDAAKALQP